MKRYPLDFIREVLQWEGSFDAPLRVLLSAPRLPAAFEAAGGNPAAAYYGSFVPLILGEAHANVSVGYQSRRDRNRQFELTVTKEYTQEADLITLRCVGRFPRDFAESQSVNVLEIRDYAFSDRPFLGVAFGSGRYINIKALVANRAYTEGECEQVVSVRFLASLITEQRMYDACRKATPLPYLPAIMRGELPEPAAPARQAAAAGGGGAAAPNPQPVLWSQLQRLRSQGVVVTACSDVSLQRVLGGLAADPRRCAWVGAVMGCEADVVPAALRGKAIEANVTAICSAFAQAQEDLSEFRELALGMHEIHGEKLQALERFTALLKTHGYRPQGFNKQINALKQVDSLDQRKLYQALDAMQKSMKRYEKTLAANQVRADLVKRAKMIVVRWEDIDSVPHSVSKQLLIDNTDTDLEQQVVDRKALLFRGVVLTAQAVGIRADQHTSLNASQEQAVDAFLSRRQAFTLLQGPPGTGKTTTIVALLERTMALPGKTVVTARSNKAVQVLVERFHRKHPNQPILLVGVESKIPPHLKMISLYNLCRELTQKIEAIERLQRRVTDPATRDVSRVFQQLIRQLRPLTQCYKTYGLMNAAILAALRSLMQMTRAPGEPADLYRSLNQAVTRVLTQLKARLAQRETVEQEALKSAKIIFATLTVLGRPNLLAWLVRTPIKRFVVDEASQAVEAETLIGLQCQPDKVLLVGDTRQLPATVTSQYATDRRFDRSLMARLADDRRQPTLMLDTQYRMHNGLCTWSSGKYYGGRLRTDPDVQASRVERAEASRLFPRAPRVFFDIRSQERSRGTSRENEQEARVIARLVRRIRERDRECSIGVIAFYAAQVTLIQRKCHGVDKLKVATVDSYQGSENDVIILSCVRTRDSIGFLRDARRLNVAVTRAKHQLVVVGNAAHLSRGRSDLKDMIDDMRAKGQVWPERRVNELLGLRAPAPRSQSSGGAARASRRKPRPDARSSARHRDERSSRETARLDSRSHGGASGGGRVTHRKPRPDARSSARHRDERSSREAARSDSRSHGGASDGGRVTHRNSRSGYRDRGRDRSHGFFRREDRPADQHRKRKPVHVTLKKSGRRADPQPQQKKQANQCFLWNGKKGSCRFGQSCKYEHPGAKPQGR